MGEGEVSSQALRIISGLKTNFSPSLSYYLAQLTHFMLTTIFLSSSSSHIPFDHESRWGTTVDFATRFLHFSPFSTALLDLANCRPVHFLMLSSHLFLCLLCLLPPFSVPCKVVLVRLDEGETCPYHCSLRLFTVVRRSSCGPIAC